MYLIEYNDNYNIVDDDDVICIDEHAVKPGSQIGFIQNGQTIFNGIFVMKSDDAQKIKLEMMRLSKEKMISMMKKKDDDKENKNKNAKKTKKAIGNKSANAGGKGNMKNPGIRKTRNSTRLNKVADNSSDEEMQPPTPIKKSKIDVEKFTIEEKSDEFSLVERAGDHETPKESTGNDEQQLVDESTSSALGISHEQQQPADDEQQPVDESTSSPPGISDEHQQPADDEQPPVDESTSSAPGISDEHQQPADDEQPPVDESTSSAPGKDQTAKSTSKEGENSNEEDDYNSTDDDGDDPEDDSGFRELDPEKAKTRKMVEIGENIFSAARLYKYANRGKKPTDVGRRLLKGVFYTDYLLFCTVSGEVGRNSTNKLLNRRNVIPINRKGLDAVIDYAYKHATNKNRRYSKEDIEKSIVTLLTNLRKKKMKRMKELGRWKV